MKNFTKNIHYLTKEEYELILNNIILSIRNDSCAIQTFKNCHYYSERYKRPTGSELVRLCKKAGVSKDLNNLMNFQNMPHLCGELTSVWQDLVAFGIYDELGTITKEQEHLRNRSNNALSRFYVYQTNIQGLSADNCSKNDYNACSEMDLSDFSKEYKLTNHSHVYNSIFNTCSEIVMPTAPTTPIFKNGTPTTKEEKDMTTPVKVTTEIMGYNKDNLTPEQAVDGLERAQKSIDSLEKSAAAETKYVKDQITELQKAVTMLTAFLNK